MAYNKGVFSKGTVTYKDLDISFKAHPFTGDIRTKEDLEAIKQSLTILLETNFGERPFRPNLGAGLNDLLFAPLDQITSIELSNNIKNVIENWEPRINVLSLQVTDKPDDNALEVSLVFSMLNISQPVKLTIILQRVR